ncbi:MAG: hypothetical protein AAGI01_09670 [Myxococcota bacterium]
MRRWKGAKSLAFDGVDAVTSLVEHTILSAAERATDRVAAVPSLAPPARAVRLAHGAVTRTTCAAIRTISRGVEGVTEFGASALPDAEPTPVPVRSDAAGSASWLADQAEGAINGLFGDFLHERGNPLDLGMTLRIDGAAVPAQALHEHLATPSAHLCVFVHGLATTEWCWSIDAERNFGDPGATYGAMLARDLGLTSVYVRYNTGRHLQANGRALADLLEEVAAAYPGPLSRLTLVGHSMGGLVARSAAFDAHQRGLAWVRKLRHLISLGSPHHGSPLARNATRLSNLFAFADVAATRVLRDLLNARSEGITDLDYGDITDLTGADTRAPHTVYCAVAATVTADPEHIAGALVGDWLVPASSARGESPSGTLFDQVATFGAVGHIGLTNHPDVYAALVEWLT